MPTSFRKDIDPPQTKYRTPSPPHDAFEPLSPVGIANTANEQTAPQRTSTKEVRNGFKRHLSAQCQGSEDFAGQKEVSRGAMDAFASIALATTSYSKYQSCLPSGQQLVNDCTDRPSKRARSEKLPSPDWSKKRKSVPTRPVTSYQQPPEDRRLEAELLLNFAQANFAQAGVLRSPSPVRHHNHSIQSQIDAAVPTNVVPNPAKQDSGGGQHYASGSNKTESGAVNSNNTNVTNVVPADESCVGEIPSDGKSVNDPQEILGIALQPSIIEGQRCVSEPTSQKSEHNDVDVLPEPSQREERSQTRQVRMHGKPKNEAYDSSTSMPDSMAHEQDLSGTIPDVIINHHTPLVNVLSSQPREQESVAKLDGDLLGNTNEPQTQSLTQELKNDPQAMVLSLDIVTNEVVERSSDSQKASSLKSSNFSGSSTPDRQSHPPVNAAVCAACKFVRNSNGVDIEHESTSWISCDACKAWFHFACAGFKSEREVRSVDKFRCRACKPLHGSTTYVRKSSRAHSAIDYAGLHQGVIKTSDERPEHHYIKPIKEGSIAFLPETFARMRPELVTAEFFGKGIGMKEPIVIPAYSNPSTNVPSAFDADTSARKHDGSTPIPSNGDGRDDTWYCPEQECETTADFGQDRLDMVVPQGLTVRQVAELYGPEEKVEVIDVKSQNGESKKWNMKRWADYYENSNNKAVRNVISLEVSQSKLGRLIKRPQIVRDLDLQDSVWPEDLLAKGEYPKVQFYCLMSVADCFTDFHIDFGGSSVFYHILRGKKTFLFIPPKEKHLKKYEEWCMSPAQNWTFLGDQTKECYRVDLSEGDTMLIPSGWIHAVWTPEDSLVIGGNFLTRMNYSMQIRVAQLEKATGVARKFRYPHFQKLHWYTALQYLETDPLPMTVRNLLHAGESFHREHPSHFDFDAWGGNSRAGLENYHVRYYSQSELDGLPDLTRYLLRTALIDIGSITDGISADTRNAVKKSIPRGHGEPLEIIKSFAAWCAWKRGNEPLPHWAYPDAVPENLMPDKLSAAATKKLDREAALSAPRRQSARMQSQRERSVDPPSEFQRPASLLDPLMQRDAKPSLGVSTEPQSHSDLAVGENLARFALSTGSGSHRKTACESCRKRRRACKHKNQIAASMAAPLFSMSGLNPVNLQQASVDLNTSPSANTDASQSQSCVAERDGMTSVSNGGTILNTPDQLYHAQSSIREPLDLNDCIATQAKPSPCIATTQLPKVEVQLSGNNIQSLDSVSGIMMQPRPRHKACNECRKSKRRCIHDAFGNEDPVKVRETAIPRPHARKSNLQSKDGLIKKPHLSKRKPPVSVHTDQSNTTIAPSYPDSGERRMAPVANMVAHPSRSESLSNTVPVTLDTAKQREIAERASLLLDPALLLNDLNDASSYPERASQISASAPSLGSDDGIERTVPTRFATNIENGPKTNHSEVEAKPGLMQLESKDSFEQPASSLVSPPASAHEDDHPATDVQWSPSRSLSEQSSTQLNQLQQRYTPESGPVRRASSSSYDKQLAEQTACQESIEPCPSIKTQPGYIADEKSLKLIKELQAQELGLRRRRVV
ncbi:JmjC domain-containing histone demethylation protein 1 [Lecanora helva]